ncbi:MAG TPA: hypothetical protein VGB73_02040 [Pyrinomonadaceae bacterium]|jgi:hypothetical protein
MPKKWFLGKGSQSFVVTRRGDLFPEEQMVLHPSIFAANVERWIADTLSQRTLLDMYESVGGGRIAAGPTHAQGNELWPKVKRLLVSAFKSGDLVMLPVYQPARIIRMLEKPAPPPSKPEQVKQKTWVEIQLLDEEGIPMDKEQYRIKLPDGSYEDGFLDKNGRARVDGIDAGMCEVSFPNLKPNTPRPAARK